MGNSKRMESVALNWNFRGEDGVQAKNPPYGYWLEQHKCSLF